jgi:isopentenyl-diphosphate delta-isomerase
MEERKKDHIDIAPDFFGTGDPPDRRFNYEPVLNSQAGDVEAEFSFLGKKMRFPLWISSMTGGTKAAMAINRNLARACNEFGIGMGLGSCRVILNDDSSLADFDLRSIIGQDYPFYANLGIAQVEEVLTSGKADRINRLVGKLRADGLIAHINPIQEFCQPEGDLITRPALETLNELLEMADYPVIVKEVGQGMGPESLKALLKMPFEAIEFAAYGGTNFSMVELKRSGPPADEIYQPLSRLGHDASEMVDTVNQIEKSGQEIRCRQLIISGGIRSFLDGYYLISKSRLPAIYGQAGMILRYARGDYKALRDYLLHQVRGLQLARACLTIREP